MTASRAGDDLREALAAGIRAAKSVNRYPSWALLDEILEYLVRATGHAQQIKERDRLIRAAGQLLPDTKPWVRARILQREAKAMLRTWRILQYQAPHVTEHSTIRDLLHAAALKGELPDGQRQLYRILMSAPTDTSLVALSAESRKDSSIHSQKERRSEY